MTRFLRIPCLLLGVLLTVSVGGRGAAALRASDGIPHRTCSTPTERSPAELGEALGPQALDLLRLGVARDRAYYDWRGARWASIMVSHPLIPGDGKNNNVAPIEGYSKEAGIRRALFDYLSQRQAELRIELSELGQPRIGIYTDGNLVQVHAPRVVDGIPVRDSGLTAIINHGNLVLLGLQNWGTLNASVTPAKTAAQAEASVSNYLSPFTVTSLVQPTRLEIVPLARGEKSPPWWRGPATSTASAGGHGQGRRRPRQLGVAGDAGRPAHLVRGQEPVCLAQIMGGVYPVSNDQRPPDGVEQPGWPMPYADITAGANNFFTDGGGNIGCSTGPVTSTLSGRYMRMVDTCGAINETSAAGDIDLGFGPNPLDTDCTVPAGHSAGDTKSSRSGFYEMNRLVEQAQGHLPTNAPTLGARRSSPRNMTSTRPATRSVIGVAATFIQDLGSACRNTEGDRGHLRPRVGPRDGQQRGERQHRQPR